jgi:predicted kinase
MLIVFGGLPGTGKTTLAKTIAQDSNATYLRIDAIEQVLRSSGISDVGPAGYLVAYALAQSNLRLGRPVVADCVNPLAQTREAWRVVAKAASCKIVEIEVVCSDRAEHRHRVETRTIDVPGLQPPTWDKVLAHDYQPWEQPHTVLETANRTVAEALDELRAQIQNAAGAVAGS